VLGRSLAQEDVAGVSEKIRQLKMVRARFIPWKLRMFGDKAEVLLTRRVKSAKSDLKSICKSMHTVFMFTFLRL